jgi:chromosome segregation ATPase
MSSFFDKIQVPLNLDYEENGLEFVNAVTVADKFAESTVINAELSRETEAASTALASADFELEQIKRKISKLRRRIFAENYGKITKSAGNEVLDAFVLSHAGPHEAPLLELEDAEQDLWKQRTSASTDLERCKAQMRALERSMNSLTEWLNYDKFRTRIHDAKVRGDL